MLKGVVSFLLQRYIGKYVENFNSDKVSVALFQGDVTLENLPLRSDALQDVLDLPIEVKSGFIGRITLKIPYTQPRSQPWVFIIERVYAVAGPSQPKRYDSAKEEEREATKKNKKLTAIDNRWWRHVRPKTEADSNGAGAGGYGSSWLSYGSSLAFNIVQNVQLHIKDVHVRYEDDTSIPGHCYSWGITIRELRAESTDQDWNPSFTSGADTEVVFKLLHLTEFSLYWDSAVPLLGRLEWDAMQESLGPENQDTQRDHNYILRPTNMSAKLKRYTSPLPLRSVDTPRICLQVSVDELPLTLTRVQYREMVALINECDRFDRMRKYRRWRPQESVSQNPSAWWKFAFRCHVRTECTWEKSIQRARQTVVYVRAYMGHLLLPVDSSKPPPVFKDSSGVEDNWSIGDVLALRELAMESASQKLAKTVAVESEKTQLQHKQQSQNQTDAAQNAPNPGRSWLWWWWSSNATAAADGSVAEEPSNRTELEFMEALSLDEDTDTMLKRDRVFVRIHFNLTGCSLSLMSAPNRGLLLVKANQLGLVFESRPRYQSMLFSASIGALTLQDARRPEDGGSELFTNLVAPKVQEDGKKNGAGQEGQSLFFFLYELNPRDSTADYRLQINSGALQIVYNPMIMAEVVEMFKEPRSGYQFRAVARQHYRQVAANARNNFRQMVSQMQRGERVAGARGRWEVEVDVRAPQFLLPNSFEKTGRPPSCVLCDFGRLEIQNFSPGLRVDQKARSRLQLADTQAGEAEMEDDDDEDDDEFRTPEGETITMDDEFITVHESLPENFDKPQLELTRAEMEDRLYERYSINLVDMQVLVGQLPELARQVDLHCVELNLDSSSDWGSGMMGRVGSLHLVDKFSLMVSLRRRLVRGKDKDFPNLCVDGELPNFLLQLSDTKVLAFQDCLSTFLSTSSGGTIAQEPPVVSPTAENSADSNSSRNRTLSHVSTRRNRSVTAPTMEEARLIAAKFVMRRLVLQIESRGRPVAECQLSGAEASWTRRPRRHELDLCIRSLLVADAMSHLGQDYDLLVASHKHVWLDSLSGNISVVQSPTSPKSPQSPVTREAPGGGFSANLHKLLSSAVSAVTSTLQEKERSDPVADASNDDVPALISVHYEWQDAVEEECPTQKIDVKFSSLDVIGNQETLVEIMAFFQRINPANTFKARLNRQNKQRKEKTARTGSIVVRTEARVTFERLNVLLIRVMDGGEFVGHRQAIKIGTVTLTGANLEGVSCDAEFVTATLAGIQVLDLTTKEALHRNIVSVGSQGIGDAEAQQSQALTVTLYRESNSANGHEYEVSLKMASVCYLHAAKFLFELGLCMSAFREYMNRLARHLKQAAAGMALSVMGSSLVQQMSLGEVDVKESLPGSQPVPMSNIKLQIHLETPVIVLPKTKVAKEVLVGHLGNITIMNTRPTSAEMPFTIENDELDLSSTFPDGEAGESGNLFIFFRDMNVHSVNLVAFEHLGSADLLKVYRQGRTGYPLVTNTSVWMRVTRLDHAAPSTSESSLNTAYMVGQKNEREEEGSKKESDTQPRLLVRARMPQALEMRLSKAVYEQILKSLDNLVFDERDAAWLERESKMQTNSIPVLEVVEEEEEGTGMRLEFDFDLPRLVVVMSGDLDGGAQNIARLSMEQFCCRMVKAETFVKLFDVRLKSLTMEDLLQHSSSPHRFLLNSVDPRGPVRPPPMARRSTSSDKMSKADFISASCPESADEATRGWWDADDSPASLMIAGRILDVDGGGEGHMSTSLPNELQTMTMPYAVRQKRQKRGVEKRKKKEREHACPTPPPSPMRSPDGSCSEEEVEEEEIGRLRERGDDLIQIRAKLVDKKAPNFVTKYNATNRFIEVDFNCLQCTLNLNTWVLILDFLGLGAKMHDHDEVLQLRDNTKLVKALNRKADGEVEDIVNSEIGLEMSRFALVFNKPEYELARASMTHLVAHVSLRDGNLSLDGTVGGLQVDDTSPAGRLYPHRFLVRRSPVADKKTKRNARSNRQAPLLTFNFFKYALPDPGLRRAEDMKLKLQLASVCYVHTQRFAMELLTFVQNFNQQQDVMGRMRAAVAGQKIAEKAPRAARISLEIDAGAPVVLLPHSWLSKKMLVMCLGNFNVRNCFLFRGTEGTLAAQRTTEDNEEEERLAALRKRKEKEAGGGSEEEQKSFVAEPVNELCVSSPVIEKRPSFVERVTLGSPGPIEPQMMNSFYGSPPESTLRLLGMPTSRLEKGSQVASRPASLPQLQPYHEHRCLLDCMRLELTDMDIYTAVRVDGDAHSEGKELSGQEGSLRFGDYFIEAESRRPVKDKFALLLSAERNLEGEVSHSSPDWNIRGQLSSVDCQLDLEQYKLVRGVLEHNLGECLDDVQLSKRLTAHPQDPSIQTVLTGNVWRGMSIRVDLSNVSIEVVNPSRTDPKQLVSLGRIDLIRSRLLYESYSDQSKVTDLSCPEVLIHDTRYNNLAVNTRPNIFSTIIQPTPRQGADNPAPSPSLGPGPVLDESSFLPPGALQSKSNFIQMELNFLSLPQQNVFTIFLDSIRLMCIFDWLLMAKAFLTTGPDNPWLSEEFTEFQRKVNRRVNLDGVEERFGDEGFEALPSPVNKPTELIFDMKGTEFVVVESAAQKDTNAVILRGSVELFHRPHVPVEPLSCRLDNLEVFSCSLSAEEETALSIVDPTWLQFELTRRKQETATNLSSSSGLAAACDPLEMLPRLEFWFDIISCRLSFNDLKLYLAIMKSLPKQAIIGTVADRILTIAEVADTVADGVMALADGESLPPPENTKKSGESSSSIQSSIASSTVLPANYRAQAPYTRRLWSAEAVGRLVEMGFARCDCEAALSRCEGDVERAANDLLTRGVAPATEEDVGGEEPNEKKGISQTLAKFLSALKLKSKRETTSISICLIDDCLDADVPLADIKMSNLFFEWNLGGHQVGQTRYTFSTDYFNRRLSAWEPIIEPWNCDVEWKNELVNNNLKFFLSFYSVSMLNFNVTPELMDLMIQTKDKWNQEFRISPALAGSSLGLVDDDAELLVNIGPRRRSPFVPFRLLNKTGSPIWFRTQTDSADDTQRVVGESILGLAGALEPSLEQTSSQSATRSQGWSGQWCRVDVDSRADLVFPREELRDKMRHQRSSVERAHRMVLQVEGWLPTSPVMVDKVGIFFRTIQADRKRVQFGDLLPNRVVFEVKKEGTAAKLIVVRSALQVTNQLREAVEVRMNASSLVEGTRSKSLLLEPEDTLPVPLKHVYSSLLIRPMGHWSVDFCRHPIRWQELQRPGGVADMHRACFPQCEDTCLPYRFCVQLKREFYPMQPVDFPGHTVTLVPPLTVVNLLPMEMSYYLKGTLMEGVVKAGEEAPLNLVNIAEKIEFGVRLEHFPNCHELTIPPQAFEHRVRLRVFDEMKRKLDLTIQISARIGGARRITISAQYWIVNRCGLPLVFRQDQCRDEAAGQFREHEMARVLMPLLFSYSDNDAAHLCAVRVGRKFHEVLDSAQPVWSSRIELDKPGVYTLQLRVQYRDSRRPDHVYNVGVEIRLGRGRYKATNIITFTPRFLLENRTSYRLLFAQRHMLANLSQATEVPEGVHSAHPRANFVYHWPRQDFDPLLCVRLADRPECRWSGGFLIQCVDSFCISMRLGHDQTCFLRVEVILQGATNFAVFTEVNDLPLPYRLDNFSEVPIVYVQSTVTDQSLRSLLRPRTSIPYVWDEPCQMSQLTLSVYGGGGAACLYNMEQVGFGEDLHYDRAVFIYMRATANRSEETEPLVLEYCPNSRRVRLRRKMPGIRYQLWELDREDRIFNLGCGGRGRSSGGSSSGGNLQTMGVAPMVLDIADLAPQPAAAGKLVPLTVNRLDPKRKRTQRWTLREHGSLLVCDAGLHVRAIELTVGADVLCASSFDRTAHRTSQASQLCRVGFVRHLGGSGQLRVQVLTDGPTRVLQIEDKQTARDIRAVPLDDGGLSAWTTVEPEDEKYPMSQGERHSLHANDWELRLTMTEGLGVSLINDSPEEVLYTALRGIKASYNRVGKSDFFETTIQCVQVDNQLLDAAIPVLLYTPKPKHSSSASNSGPSSSGGIGSGEPLLSFSFSRELQSQWNAVIFKYCQFHLRKINVELEDRLLWRLIQFFKVDQRMQTTDVNETEHEHQRVLAAATSAEQQRYYFGSIKIHFGVITLSVQKSANLPSDLLAIKTAMPFPLLNFENARIVLAPFEGNHVFMTQLLLTREITGHYRQELKNQAMRILVSFDFLGNPMGFINDLSEGVSGIVEDMNIRGFLRNVAHGVTNSSAKVTGTFSDLVNVASMDRRHDALRQKLRNDAGKEGGSVAHFSAGVKGLGYGLVGGLTSVITQPYYGYSDDGVEGLATGLVKGLVGTVAKPVGGALDLISGTLSSLRETAKPSTADKPDRTRTPRSCGSIGRPLQVYGREQAEGQQLLRAVISSSRSWEKLYLQMILQSKQRNESVRVLVTDGGVHCVRTGGSKSQAILMFSVDYGAMTGCHSSMRLDRHYLDLVMVGRSEPISVRCDNAMVADMAVQEIREALYRSREVLQTLPRR